jgi:hypothetical protein
MPQCDAAELMPQLDPRINLEFNAYFLDMALKAGVRIWNVPISFIRASARARAAT